MHPVPIRQYTCTRTCAATRRTPTRRAGSSDHVRPLARTARSFASADQAQSSGPGDARGTVSSADRVANGRADVKAIGATVREELAEEEGVAARKKRRYPSLRGSDFQHALDKQNTQILRSLPGLEFVAKSMIMSTSAEEVLFLENISSSVLVGPDQLPTLYRLLTDACETLGMTNVPDLYVRQNPVPNAYTLALTGRRPFIVLHTSLLDLLSDDELQAVIAHELGHLKCDHAVWLTAANVLALGTVSLLPIVSATVEDAVMRWLRAAELSCDRAALLVVQDPKVVVSSFMKLAGGSGRFASELSVDAFLQQAKSYEQASSSPLGWYLRNAQNRALSHPLPVLRAAEIDTWSRSMEYRNIGRASG